MSIFNAPLDCLLLHCTVEGLSPAIANSCRSEKPVEELLDYCEPVGVNSGVLTPQNAYTEPTVDDARRTGNIPSYDSL